MVVEYISDTTECRRLSRNVITGDFIDAKIISYQKKIYSYIATTTDKDDWDSGDREFGALQLVETKLTAAIILQHYGTAEDVPIWTAMRAEAMTDLFDDETGIIANMDAEGTDADSDVQVTERKGWGLNPNLSPPNRLNKGLEPNTESF